MTPWTIHTVHGILQARILGWIAFPFSRGSSQPRNQTPVSHIVGRFFTSWATGEAPKYSFRKILFIYLFLLVLGLSCCTRAFSGCCEQGSPFLRCLAFSLRWLLLFQSVGSRCVGVNRCSTRTELLWGMWDLPGPGMEPVSSALAGGFLSTGPPEKSLNTLSWIRILIVWGFSHTGYNHLFSKKKFSEFSVFPGLTLPWRETSGKVMIADGRGDPGDWVRPKVLGWWQNE